MASNKSLLFIPDISGYTDFVNNTEISHQQHILTELLELLIDSNELDMELAEIEGDALFYYKTSDLPSQEEIIAQIQRMFVNFHNHIRYYDKYRLCQCGACTGATGLNIKFVVHTGEITFLKIKNRKPKPHGHNVILAHRILKNNVDSDEYVLMTNSARNDFQLTNLSQNVDLKFENCTSEFGSDDVGTVEYCFAELGHFKKLIKEPENLKYGGKVSNPERLKTLVKAKPVDVFGFLINLGKRKEWHTGLQDIKYEENVMQKIGAKHVCIIDNSQIDVQNVVADFGDGAWVFGEKSNLAFSKELYIYHVVRPTDKGSIITTELHVIPRNWFYSLILPLIKKKFVRALRPTLDNLKNLVESNVVPVIPTPTSGDTGLVEYSKI